ncbi:MAG: hypothetical protein KAU31_12330, partial [Spirochaetaceae bacterium]|nr:hypothetical protein [Spirochaetaceae bacterium]
MRNRVKSIASVRPAERLVMFGLAAALFVGCATAPEVEVEPQAPAAEGGIQPVERTAVPDSVILGEWAIGPGDFVVGHPGGNIRLELYEMPTTANPAANIGLAGDAQLLPMLFSSLVDRHPALGTRRVNLAESYTVSADSRVIDVTLRDGLLWSDGTPLTADDVVYSYNQLHLNPELGGIGVEAAEQAGGITVTRTGEQTVWIASGVSTNELLEVLGYPPMPRHIVEPWLAERDPVEFLDFWSFTGDLSGHVGSGPFVLSSFNEAETFDVGPGVFDADAGGIVLAVVELERNPLYHLTDAAGQQLPYLDSVTFFAREDIFAGGSLYWGGLIDVTYLPIWDWEGRMLGVRFGNSGHRSRETALMIPGAHYLVADTARPVGTLVAFNLQRAPGPQGGGLDSPMSDWFNDLRFRQAVSHLIPRDRIVSQLHDGDAVPAYSRIAPGFANHSAEAESAVPRYDPEAAAALLDEMLLIDRDGDGIREDPDGTPVSFVMNTNDGNLFRMDLLELLAEELRQAGLDVSAELMDFQPLVQSIYGASYQAIVLGLGGGDTVDDGWNVYASDGDLHLWDLGQEAPQREWEQRLDDLHREWVTTIHRDRRLEIEHEVQLIATEQLP